MTYATFGFIEAKPGKQDELAELLSTYNPKLVEAGCLYCVVGISQDEPDKVLIAELWPSEDAYQAFQKDTGMNKLLSKMRRLITGTTGSTKFVTVGSPLQDN